MAKNKAEKNVRRVPGFVGKDVPAMIAGAVVTDDGDRKHIRGTIEVTLTDSVLRLLPAWVTKAVSLEGEAKSLVVDTDGSPIGATFYSASERKKLLQVEEGSLKSGLSVKASSKATGKPSARIVLDVPYRNEALKFFGDHLGVAVRVKLFNLASEQHDLDDPKLGEAEPEGEPTNVPFS